MMAFGRVVRVGVGVGAIILFLSSAIFAQTSRAVFSNNTPNAIPTVAGTAASYPSTIAVSGVTGVTYHVTVTLKISHTFPSDLSVMLKAPNDRTVMILSDIGNDEDWVQRVFVFDDCAPRAVRLGLLGTGRYRTGNTSFAVDMTAPAPIAPYGNNLAEFNWVPPNGNWQLYVEDRFDEDGGSIDSWSLTIFSQPAASIPVSADSGVNPISCSTPDYDGDGRTDRAIYRPQTGEWYALQSGSSGAGAYLYAPWGAPASSGSDDVAVPADYDGDGVADFAVYRRTTGDWWVRRSFDGTINQVNFGAPSSSGADDRPVPGDYDGDGRADRAVYRATTGTWWVLSSATGATIPTQWGNPPSGDYPAR